MRSLILFILFSFTLDTAAIADKKSDTEEFNEAYKSYKTEIAKDNLSAARYFAKKAYELASKIKPTDSKIYAQITYNYAKLIAKTAYLDDSAKKVVVKTHNLYTNLLNCPPTYLKGNLCVV